MIGSLGDFINSQKVIDYTVNGVCSNCGECCTALLPVTYKELLTIKKYIKRYDITPKTTPRILKDTTLDLTCPFRSGSVCMIYDVRPNICKAFLCSHKTPEESFTTSLVKTHKDTKTVNFREEFCKYV
jgi:Fe-S-cluster containining protein